MRENIHTPYMSTKCLISWLNKMFSQFKNDKAKSQLISITYFNRYFKNDIEMQILKLKDAQYH